MPCLCEATPPSVRHMTVKACGCNWRFTLTIAGCNQPLLCLKNARICMTSEASRTTRYIRYASMDDPRGVAARKHVTLAVLMPGHTQMVLQLKLETDWAQRGSSSAVRAIVFSHGPLVSWPPGNQRGFKAVYRIASLCSVMRPSPDGQPRASSADRQACDSIKHLGLAQVRHRG